MHESVLEVQGLIKNFSSRRGPLGRQVVDNFAVNNVSFSISTAETLGIVGESGCGKSTLALTVMRLYEPDSGTICFDGTNITNLSGRELKQIRRQMHLVFQNPLAAFDPRLSIEQIIGEPLEIHGIGDRSSNRDDIAALLRRVGLYADDMQRYPAEFSGGQQQRIGIARALAMKPRVLIFDEPVSALDTSVQAQILNLLRDLQDEFGFSYMFISHNIAVTAFMSDRIGVMFAGKLVEIGDANTITAEPRHPYTQALLAAIPEPDPLSRMPNLKIVEKIENFSGLPSGCAFRARCPSAREICSVEVPQLREVQGGQQAACHFA